jgi:lysophospholipase L1-like esterase
VSTHITFLREWDWRKGKMQHIQKKYFALAGAITAIGITALDAQSARADVTFSGGDAKIVYTGRNRLFTDYQYSPDRRKVEFYWTGSEARIRFSGSTKVLANIRITNASGSGDYKPLAYILDGNYLRRETVGGLGGTTTIATGLSTGEHTLVIRRDGESDGRVWIETIALDNGAQLLQAPAVNSTRKIEFYGDSITEGANPVRLANSTSDGETWGASNYYAYAARVQRNFNADARFIAKGGIGVSSTFWFHTMPQVWNRLYAASDAPVYSMSSWIPNVVVMAVGHNDQFNQNTSTDWYNINFKPKYIQQIKDIRAVYPNAHIICMNTTMTGPSFFDGVWNAMKTDSQLKNDTKLHYKSFSYQNHGGHPTGPDHENMASQITTLISQITGWSSGSTTGPNLISNPSFDAENYDTQTPSGWSEYGANQNASYTESYGGSNSGARHGTHWSSNAYQVYTYQLKTGLANGLYTLRCRAKRGSGQKACYIEAINYGGSARTANLPVTNSYTLVEIKDINVTNGQCQIGFWSDANAGNWAYFDDVEFFKQ